MRKICKSVEPVRLTEFKLHKNPITWNDIHLPGNNDVYQDCVEQCYIDQNGLDGYTEVRLSTHQHIDHFIKRSIDPRKTFEWENMILANKSKKFGADFKDKTLTNDDYDITKQKYKQILNPITDNVEDHFCYMTDGSILALTPNDGEAIETIRVFNLQEESLKERRKQKMEAVRTLLETGQFSKDQIKEYFKEEEFPSAINYELSL